MAAEAEGAAPAGDLVIRVAAEAVEFVFGDEWFGGADGAAFGGAAEVGGRGEASRWGAGCRARRWHEM